MLVIIRDKSNMEKKFQEEGTKLCYVILYAFEIKGIDVSPN
jgi:hypothetical protein